MNCDSCGNETNTNFAKIKSEVHCYSCSTEIEKRRIERVALVTDEEKARIEEKKSLEESKNGVLFSRDGGGSAEKATMKVDHSNSLNLVISVAAIVLVIFLSYNPLVKWFGSEEAAVGVIALGVSYFIPYLLALLRGHLSAGAIFLTVLLLGWTGIGWVVALIWSCTGNTRNNLVRRKS